MKKVIDWDTYFMALAHMSALRSKDPNTTVGAVIVDNMHRIVSIGYNGMPRGLDETVFPWDRDGGFLDTKYAYVVHAEMNAIFNAPRPVNDCTIFVTLFPCNECAKAIIQSGIKEVVYESDKYHDDDVFVASRKLLEGGGVRMRKLDTKINIDLTTEPND